jgi:hypothetical protein
MVNASLDEVVTCGHDHERAFDFPAKIISNSNKHANAYKRNSQEKHRGLRDLKNEIYIMPVPVESPRIRLCLLNWPVRPSLFLASEYSSNTIPFPMEKSIQKQTGEFSALLGSYAIILRPIGLLTGLRSEGRCRVHDKHCPGDAPLELPAQASDPPTELSTAPVPVVMHCGLLA